MCDVVNEGDVVVMWQIRRKQKSGEALVDEEYYQQRDSGEWLLRYHVTSPGSETWALTEFDKVGTCTGRRTISPRP